MKEVFWVDDEKLAEALSDQTRIEILLLLDEKGPVSLRTLSETLGKHRSTVFRHVSKLLNAGLVERRKIGEYFEYRLTDLGSEIVESIRSGSRPVSPRRQKTVSLSRGKIIVVSFALGLMAMMIPVRVHALTRLLVFMGITLTSYLILGILFRTSKIRRGASLR